MAPYETFYDVFRSSHARRPLTSEEEAEYTQLKELLENATQMPADDFPWHRWKELSEKRFLSRLPKERPSRELFRAIQDGAEELKKAEEQLRLWPLTNANADAQNKLATGIDLKHRQIEAALVMLDRMIEDENELFGPASPEGAAARSIKSAVAAPKPHSLLGICVGKTTPERKAQAELLDQMFEAAKQAVSYDADRYATASVAVYKLAEYLRVIEEGTKSTVWVPLLAEQYSVTVTEGQSKYSFKNPSKSVFIKAVNAAYEVYSKRYPHKAKAQQLPAGY